MKRFDLTRPAAIFVVLIASVGSMSESRSAEPAGKSKSPLNILCIGVDDLRPELASYGATYIKSPNLTGLPQKACYVIGPMPNGLYVCNHGQAC